MAASPAECACLRAGAPLASAHVSAAPVSAHGRAHHCSALLLTSAIRQHQEDKEFEKQCVCATWACNKAYEGAESTHQYSKL